MGCEILHGNQTNPNAQPASVQRIASLSLGLEWPQCGGDHQPYPSTELQMGQCYTSTSPLCLPTDVMKWPSPLPPLKAKWNISKYVPCELIFCISDMTAPEESSFSALWRYMQSNYRHHTPDNNTPNFWLPHVILGFCSDAVFHFSNSTTSDIVRARAKFWFISDGIHFFKLIFCVCRWRNLFAAQLHVATV